MAVGNLTGAMMFQGSLLPAVGIMLTAWVPQKEILVGMAMTLVGSHVLNVAGAAWNGEAHSFGF